jgi:serine palmitoyltransferase
MIIGSLSGPLCAAGGFCAGNEEVVEHQRISSASYTYSAALPALLSTTASETISLLQEQPEILTGLRENVKAMRAMLDPRSDWVRCSSFVDNPILLLVLKDEVIENKKLSIDDQNQIFREVVDEVRSIPPPPSPPSSLVFYLFLLAFGLFDMGHELTYYLM